MPLGTAPSGIRICLRNVCETPSCVQGLFPVPAKKHALKFVYSALLHVGKHMGGHTESGASLAVVHLVHVAFFFVARHIAG